MSSTRRGGKDPSADPGPALEELLAKATRVCQDAEVFFVQHKDVPVRFESNRLKLVETRESWGSACWTKGLVCGMSPAFPMPRQPYV